MRALSILLLALIGGLWAPGCFGQTLSFKTPGATSFVVPADINQINFGVYGPAFQLDPADDPGMGGAGGGFCQIQLAVTPGQTIHLQVGSNSGTSSWVNISGSSAPGSSAQGCLATGGTTATTPGAGTMGTVNTTGGHGNAGPFPSGGQGGGGGGGAGPGGNGSDATGSVGGAGGHAALGFPAGGTGGTGGTNGGSLNPGSSGAQPGAGGGGGGVNGPGFVANNGGAAPGEVIAIFLAGPPTSTTPGSMFLTWPG